MQFGQQQGSDMEFGAPQKPGTVGEGALAPSASSSGNMYSNRDQTIAEGPLSRDQEMEWVHEIGGKGELRNMIQYPNCKDLDEIGVLHRAQLGHLWPPVP
jgi:hypothetical protein